MKRETQLAKSNRRQGDRRQALIPRTDGEPRRQEDIWQRIDTAARQTEAELFVTSEAH